MPSSLGTRILPTACTGSTALHHQPRASFAAALRLLLEVVLLDHRHRIDARHPAIEVDILAALRAERPQPRLGRLAADRALRGFHGVGGLGQGFARQRYLIVN